MGVPNALVVATAAKTQTEAEFHQRVAEMLQEAFDDMFIFGMSGHKPETPNGEVMGHRSDGTPIYGDIMVEIDPWQPYGRPRAGRKQASPIASQS
jgi:hypothetical protein